MSAVSSSSPSILPFPHDVLFALRALVVSASTLRRKGERTDDDAFERSRSPGSEQSRQPLAGKSRLKENPAR